MDDDKRKKHLDLINVKMMLTLAGAGCIIVVFYLFIGKIGGVLEIIKKLLSSMAPIIIGLVIAFLLNPMVNKMRVNLRSTLKSTFKNIKDEKAKKISDVLAVSFAMLFFIAVIVGFMWILLPSLYDSLIRLYENFDQYTTNLEQSVTNLVKDHPDIVNMLNNYMDDIEEAIKNVLTQKLLPNMDGIVKSISSGIMGGLKILMNFLIGMIAAIYVLGSKDKFSAQFKKVIYAFLSRKQGNTILKAIDYIDGVFSGFIVGKIVDSLIIGMICFIFCRLVDMPYAVLISVVIGITNIIPFFGPFIGAIPSAVLVMVESPKMCLVFIIFIIVLQQVDGNIIGPLVLSDSTGLSSFWILFAILVGGNLFGFIGMIIGVPAFACLYALMKKILTDNLQKRGFENNTDYFVALRGFDDNGNPVRGPKRVFESAKSQKKREKNLEQLRHSKEIFDKVTHKDKSSDKTKTDNEAKDKGTNKGLDKNIDKNKDINKDNNADDNSAEK